MSVNYRLTNSDDLKFCDGKNDCSGGKTGEDEHALGCHSATCDGFQCDNGVCLHHTMTCDNEDDCGDGSDESAATCSGRNVTCSDSQFQCRSNKYCISTSKLCNSYKEGDYYADCVDGSDEDAAYCASDEFQCTNEQRPYKCKGATEAPFCVPQAWVNDGMDDCANGFDEQVFIGNKLRNYAREKNLGSEIVFVLFSAKLPHQRISLYWRKCMFAVQ